MASRITARRRRRPATENIVVVSDPLAHRCRSLLRRGRYRQAAQLLRELANRDQSPAAWVRLGALLARVERTDAALDAFKQGWWLHRQRGAPRRAEVVQQLMAQVQRSSLLHAA